MTDFEKIYLSRKELKLLKRIHNKGIWQRDPRVNSEEFKALRSYGMLDICTKETFPPNLDEYGNHDQNAFCTVLSVSRYFIYLKNKRKDRQEQSRRYWITTAISILAIIISGIALLSELGLIQLPSIQLLS